MEENMHPDFLDEEEPMEPEKKQFSVKSFFKSTAFKCIYVLLAIVLICGVLLALCNDLFYISPEERLDRVLSKIYPDGTVEEIIYNEDNPTKLETEYDNGAVVAAYKMDDGNYLINSYGTGGYGGKVYMWIVFEMKNGSIGGIGNIALDKTDGETYLDRLQPGEYEWFSDNYEDGENFVASDYTSNTLGTAASAYMTRTAITNAVNTALEFVRTQLLGEVVGPDPFEGFSYTDYIDTTATTVELAEDGTSVIFHITTGNIVTGASKVDITVSSEGVITGFEITSEGTTDGYTEGILPSITDKSLFLNKTAADLLPLLGTEGEDGFTWENADESLVSGSTMSNFYYVYAAVFAASNYQNGYVMALENSVQYTQYIDMENTTVEVSGTDVIYHITTGNIVTGASKVDITVSSEGVITGFEITSEGTTDGYTEGILPSITDKSLFLNKTAADLLPLLGTEGEDGFTWENADESLVSGSTMSNFYYVYAAVFAASNYEIYPLIEEARLNLEMSNVYGESVSVEAVDVSSFTTSFTNGALSEVYSVAGTDDYIVSATGNGGYEDGTVTCWIVVETENGAVSGIGNVVIAGNEKQSFISYISDENLAHFGESFDGSDFELADWKNNNLTGGASMSTTAIINSVNIAKNFVSANLISGGENA